MEPVSNVGRLLESLRKQLVEKQGKNLGTSSRQRAGSAPAGTRIGIGELQKGVASKLQALDPNDVRFQSKATRAFLESVLSWEFGEHLKQDPKFYALVDELQAAMVADSAVASDLAALVRQLR